MGVNEDNKYASELLKQSLNLASEVAEDVLDWAKANTSRDSGTPKPNQVFGDNTSAIDTFLNTLQSKLPDRTHPVLEENEILIGNVAVTVPPESIEITEIRGTQAVPGLRTNTESLIRTGRGELSISMTIRFPNRDAVNNQLRHIIALHRSIPFITLTSEFVANNIKKRYVEEFDTTKLIDMRNKVDRVNSKFQEEIDAVLSLLTFNMRYRAPEMIEDFASMLANEKPMSVGKLTYYQNEMFKLFKEANKSEELLQDFTSKMVSIRTLYVERSMLQNAIASVGALRKTDGPPIVPVAFESIEYGPDMTRNGEAIPGAIRARLTFAVFNFMTYSRAFEFKDGNGLPTPDMSMCPWVERYVHSRFLTGSPVSTLSPPTFTDSSDKPLAEYSEDYDGVLGFRFPTTQMERVASISAQDRYLNPLRTVMTDRNKEYFPQRFTVPLIERPDSCFINIFEDMVFEKDNENVIVDGVIVRLENQLSMQPTLGSMYPTYQFLGSLGAKVSIVLNIVGAGPNPCKAHDDILRKFQYMKHESEQVALKGPRQRRHHKIFIANSLLGLAGIYAVQITDIKAAAPPPGRSGGGYQTSLALDMIEFRVSQEQREALVGSSFSEDDEVRLALEFATKYYGENKGGVTIPERVETPGFTGDANNWGYTVQDILGKHLYGSDIGPAMPDPLRGNEAYAFLNALISMAKVDPSAPPNIAELMRIFGSTAEERLTHFKIMRDLGLVEFGLNTDISPFVDRGKDPGLPTNFKWTEKGTSIWYNTNLLRMDRYSNIPYIMGIFNTDSVAKTLMSMGEFNDDHLKINILNITDGGNVESIDKRLNDAKNSANTKISTWVASAGYSKAFNYTPLKVMYPSGRLLAKFIDVVLAQDVSIDPVLSVSGKLRNNPVEPASMDLKINLKERVLIMSRWMSKYIPEYKEKIIASKQMKRRNSAYPDLSLPTYDNVFKEVFDSILKADPSFDGDLNSLGDELKGIVQRFVPTYQDLGAIPPPDRKSEDFARSAKSIVDPDFIWYHDKSVDIVNVINSSFKRNFEIEEEIDIIKKDPGNPKKNNGNFGNWTSLGTSINSRTGTNRWAQDSEAWYKSSDNNNSDHLTKTSVNKINNYKIELGSEDNKGGKSDYMSYADVATNDDTATYMPLRPDSKAFQLDINRKCIQSWKDDRWRMINAYPTFQLYFIEQDAEEWTLLDDFFGYTSVVDIHINQHKYRGSVANISVVNVSGSLDEALASAVAMKRYKHTGSTWYSRAAGALYGVMSNENTWELIGKYGDDMEFLSRAAAKEVPDRLLELNTGEDINADHAFIGVGTMIAVKMGYSSNTDDLEDVFVGQIAEIERGDVIKIVAQDYTTELSVPIDKEKMVEYMFKLPFEIGADAPSVIKTVMDESPSEHFGTVSVYGAVARIFGSPNTDRYGVNLLYSGANGERPGLELKPDAVNQSVLGYLYSGVSNIASYALHPEKIIETRKMENVFFPYASFLHKLFSLPGWTIPHKAGLEVLYEVARHNPGWVAAARPYDLNGMTLFFGKPSNPYFYTAWGLNSEEEWINNRYTELQKAQVEVKKFINDFTESKWGNKYIEYALYLDGKRPACSDSSLARMRGTSADSYADSIERMLGPGALKALFIDFFNRQSKVMSSSIAGVEELSGETLDVYSQLDPKLRAVLVGDPKDVDYIFDSNYFAEYMPNGGSTNDGPGYLIPEYTAIPADQEDYKDLDMHKEYAYVGAIKNAIPAGAIFAKFPDWRQKVTILSMFHRAETLESVKRALGVDTEKYSEWLISKAEYVDMSLVKESGATFDQATTFGDVISESTVEEAVNSAMEVMDKWRGYLFCVARWVSENIDDPYYLDVITKAGQTITEYSMSPRMRPFRSYHAADSNWNIIHNGIKASADTMDNVIKVNYTSSPSVTASTRIVSGNAVDTVQAYIEGTPNKLVIPFDQRLAKSERRVREVTEINARTISSAERCAYSNLAEAMRTMYRGSLILRGNARIRPWDIIQVADFTNEMHGPVEVEEVTHHFSLETGFISSVVPHAVMLPNTQSDWKHCWVQGLIYGGLGLLGQALCYVGGIGLITTGFTGGAIGLSAILWGPGIVSDYLEFETGTGVLGNLKGRGIFGGRVHPIDVMPLTVSGYPYVAGMRSFATKSFASRIGEVWENVGKVKNYAANTIKDIIDGNPAGGVNARD